MSVWITTKELNHSQLGAFNNSSDNAIIEHLNILKNENGDIKLQVKAKNQDAYSHLEQGVIQAQFPPPDFFNKRSMSVSITTSDLGHIRNFITMLENIEPQFFEIKQTVFALLQIDPNQEYITRPWIQSGEFDSHQPLTLTNCSAVSNITQFFILKDQNDNLTVEVHTEGRRAFNRIKQAALNAGATPPTIAQDNLMIMPFSVSSSENTKQFIDALHRIEPKFKSIKQDVCDALNIPYTPLAYQYNAIRTKELSSLLDEAGAFLGTTLLPEKRNKQQRCK